MYMLISLYGLGSEKLLVEPNFQVEVSITLQNPCEIYVLYEFSKILQEACK